MHEMGLAVRIVEMALERASEAGSGAVTGLELAVGDLSGVSVEALRFALETAVSGTPAEGAELQIRRLPAMGQCTACDQVFELPDRLAGCPHCGTSAPLLLSGREFRLEAIQVS
nr:hydrogenase maturation nickel metallochaperone HypA [uncultured Holophaga sp.]